MARDQRMSGGGRLRGCVWLIVGAGVLAGLPAGAADRLIVGVLSQQLVIEQSKTGRQALDELKAYSAARQKIIASDEEELKSLEEAVQSTGLKEEQRKEKESLFLTKVEAYQRRVQAFNREIQQKQSEMVSKYAVRIAAAAAAVAKRRGYTAVVDQGTESNLRIVIYHHPSIDMTDEVIKELDGSGK